MKYKNLPFKRNTKNLKFKNSPENS